MGNLTGFTHDVPILMLYEIDYKSWSESERQDVLALVVQFSSCMQNVGHTITNFEISDYHSLEGLKKIDPDKYVVFNWCEGIPGIPHSFHLAAKYLENLGFTFTGTSSDSLLLNGNKQLVKGLLTRNAITTPLWEIYDIGTDINWDLFPAIIKPALEHCSIGITPNSVVSNHKLLIKQIEYVWDQYEQPALVEEFISGREFQVGVWGNDEINILPPVEADFSNLADTADHLCTMDSKDDPQSYRYKLWDMKIPTPLSKSQLKELRAICINAYKATDCRDYARMDVRLRSENFYILDVNANPYIGPECGLVRSAELEGYSYGQFGSKIINFALKRKEMNI